MAQAAAKKVAKLADALVPWVSIQKTLQESQA